MFLFAQQTHICAGKGNLEAKPAGWPVKEAHHQVWLARNCLTNKLVVQNMCFIVSVGLFP